MSRLISRSDRLVRSSRQINDPLSPLQCPVPSSSSSSLPANHPPSLISTGHPSTTRLHPLMLYIRTQFFCLLLVIKLNEAMLHLVHVRRERLPSCFHCSFSSYIPILLLSPQLFCYTPSLSPLSSPPLPALTICSTFSMSLSP